MRVFHITIFIIAFAAVIPLSCKEDPPETENGNGNGNGNGEEDVEFMVGGDISLLDKINEYGGIYKVDGIEQDAIEIFRDNGYNWARLRLFHTPNMKGATVQDLAYVLKASQRIKEAGLKLLLNFHYSDTWADPGKQYKPAAWAGLDFDTLVDSVYRYTLYVMNAFASYGITPDMVQTGNEISYGMIWPDGKLDGNSQSEKDQKWDQFAQLVKAGIKGVRESQGGSEIPVMIHVASGGEVGTTQWFFENLLARGVRFEVIGQSYYPWWHGTLEMLEENMTYMSQTYIHDVVIVETAYQWKGTYPSDAKWGHYQPYPLTEQGQFDFLRYLYNLCQEYPNVTGLFYWYPESIETVPEANLMYFDRSLFTEDGEALPGISAWKPEAE